MFTVAQDNTAKAQLVKTDGAYQNLTLVTSGLQPGDRVIVDGQTPRSAQWQSGRAEHVPTRLPRPRQRWRRMEAAAVSFSELFIKRPIMTTLVMAAILIFGIFAYRLLPVSDLPNVDFPPSR